jgi:hypothetical protein
MSTSKFNPDPAVEPMVDSEYWYQSGPEPIQEDLPGAVLMVRIGMALNALVAELDVTTLVFGGLPTHSRQVRATLSRVVTTAALVSEATKLASENLRELRPLAVAAGAPPDLLQRIGQLCGGKHPASKVIEVARNKVGFHWDSERIKNSVLGFGNNPQLVWLEGGGEHVPLHRLASDVMGLVLFPDTNTPDIETYEKTLKQALSEIVDATNLIIEFFLAVTFAFHRAHEIQRRERPR